MASLASIYIIDYNVLIIGCIFLSNSMPDLLSSPPWLNSELHRAEVHIKDGEYDQAFHIINYCFNVDNRKYATLREICEAAKILCYFNDSYTESINKLYDDAGISCLKNDGNIDDIEEIISGVDNTKIPKLPVFPIFGIPSSHPEYESDIFVIMPFREELNPVFDTFIKIGANLGLSIKRGDDFTGRYEIMKEIWEAIYACKILIVDCTGRNANVFYELGIAHTIGKISILIAQDVNDIPFDIASRRAIIYKNDNKGLQVLETSLKSRIKTLFD